MEKKHIETALKALYSRERTIQNSFHSLHRSLENAKTYRLLQANIEDILKRIENRQEQLTDVTTAIYYLETHLEQLEEKE